MIKLNGTIQEVHRELLRQNPNWDTDYPANNITSPKLDKRAFDVSGYFCHGRWAYCDGIAIENGIAYLRRVRGLPHLSPGPGECGRVSCSWNSAIYWCNDVSWFFHIRNFFTRFINKISKARGDKTLLGGFGDIADGAQFLVDRCRQGIRWPVLSGQAFSTTDWNVIVRHDSCWEHSRYRQCRFAVE